MTSSPSHAARLFQAAAAFSLLTLAGSSLAIAQIGGPGSLLVSRSVYPKNNAVTVGEILPPNCTHTTGGCSASTGAIAGSEYPYVFNNDVYDGSFGITSEILLDSIDTSGNLLGTVVVPNSSVPGVTKESDQLVTSFSSKSELALHLSLDGNFVTFMGYVAHLATIDASNSNTPGVIDPTNPVGEDFYRAVATVDSKAHFTFTETNAYSGNNGRAAILNNLDGHHLIYTAGNAGNGNNPQPDGVILGAGTQLILQTDKPEWEQDVRTPTPVGSFNITELGHAPDKIGKDDNFRGIAIFNNVLYYSKGSGGNGVNTVYFLDTTGTACPNGVGLPVAGAALPTKPVPYDEAMLQTQGLHNNMCILSGFPTALAKKANPVAYPFGIWFANATTLYIADEGDGYTGGTDLYTHAAAQTTAGLQKWVFNASTQSWNLAYVLSNGLGIGTPYTVANYPTGTNAVTGLPWAPTTDGLRNITGLVGDGSTVPAGSAVIYAVSSTVSGAGDQGADPNKLYAVVDNIANTDPSVAASEQFSIVRSANSGEVLRGVTFAPGTAGITSF